MGFGRGVRSGLLIMGLAVAGCGAGETTVGPEPTLERFVGTWDAVEFLVTNSADPSDVADMLIDGRFTVNVQPSGSYTATLIFGDLPPFVEIGQLSVNGDFVRFRPTGDDPCPASSRFEFLSEVRITLEGPTCLDINLDGEPENADAFIEMVLRT